MFPKIIELFDNAATELKFPSVTIATAVTENTLYLTRTGSKSKLQTGSVAIRSQRQFNGSTYYGHIGRNGNWFPKQLTDYDKRVNNYSVNDWAELMAEVTDTLTAFNQDPSQYATAHGRKFNNCCFCALELTQKDSVAVGYGPVCAEKWGLPHEGMAAEIEADKALDELNALTETPFNETAEYKRKTELTMHDALGYKNPPETTGFKLNFGTFAGPIIDDIINEPDAMQTAYEACSKCHQQVETVEMYDGTYANTNFCEQCLTKALTQFTGNK